jgi:putative colanic acid biosynthesis acetyltransferase WcaF
LSTHDDIIMQDITSPHAFSNRLARLLWGIVWLILFRPTPRFLHRWRIFLLRCFGAKVHWTARIYPRAKIWLPSRLVMEQFSCIGEDVDCYNVGGVVIEEFALVSQYAHLCGATHDANDTSFALIPQRIVVERRSWVAADVFVAGGVTIGEGAVIGARSSVFKDMPPWMVCVGSPAKPLKPRGIGPADFGE